MPGLGVTKPFFVGCKCVGRCWLHIGHIIVIPYIREFLLPTCCCCFFRMLSLVMPLCPVTCVVTEQLKTNPIYDFIVFISLLDYLNTPLFMANITCNIIFVPTTFVVVAVVVFVIVCPTKGWGLRPLSATYYLALRCKCVSTEFRLKVWLFIDLPLYRVCSHLAFAFFAIVHDALH